MRERRKTGAMEDFVRIRIPDAGEKMRVGEGALDGVVLLFQLFTEERQRRSKDVDSAGIHGAESGFALHEVQGGAALGAGLGQREVAAIELEDGKALALAVPLQPARDHEVDHQEEIAFEREDDPLAEAAQANPLLAFRARHRRYRRAQQERVEQPDAHQARAEDAPLQALEVDGYVGKLGQAKRAGWDESR